MVLIHPGLPHQRARPQASYSDNRTIVRRRANAESHVLQNSRLCNYPGYKHLQNVALRVLLHFIFHETKEGATKLSLSKIFKLNLNRV